jgi:hypothetical protein
VNNPLRKGSEDTRRQLLKPELNPLFNPMLAENMGRWAEVYYTSPPERRQQAVSELLRELEKENHERQLREGAYAESSPRPRLTGSVLCPACQTKNQADQRFCGSCGTLLRESITPAVENAVRLAHPAQPSMAAGYDNLEWLRRKSRQALAQNASWWRSPWSYLMAGSAFLLAGGLLWLGFGRHPAVETQGPPINAGALISQPEVGGAPQSSLSANTSPRTTAASPSAGSRGARRPGLAPIESAGTTDPRKQVSAASELKPAAADSSESGEQELSVAEHYLNGKGTTRDASEAAKWLWKAVRKQNANALVPLSELYLRGEGVARSCDQARLLLVAAAKKGVPSAEPKLRNLETTPCP